MKRLLLLCILSGAASAYVDDDMDGVDNADDRCPDTPLNALVDEHGCTLVTLRSKGYYSVALGAGYSQLNYSSNEKDDTFTTSLQADYAAENVSVHLFASSYTSSQESGWNDTLIAADYRWVIDDRLSLKGGIGILLPTYDSGYGNGAADYAASLAFSYLFTPSFGVSGGYSHTFVGDDDVPGILTYHDTDAYFAAFNVMPTPTLAVGASYQSSDSIYRTLDPIQTLSAMGLYRIDTHWFTQMTYAYGLSESASDHALDVRVGYTF